MSKLEIIIQLIFYHFEITFNLHRNLFWTFVSWTLSSFYNWRLKNDPYDCDKKGDKFVSAKDLMCKKCWYSVIQGFQTQGPPVLFMQPATKSFCWNSSFLIFEYTLAIVLLLKVNMWWPTLTFFNFLPVEHFLQV